jgi:hypothetical protein
MNADSIELVDSLSLLSLKVASNVFDLSSGQHHISIRDQMVRAQLVVRDLKRGDPNLNSLLIVGAGVAGIAAALEAVDRGVEHVLVVDAGSEPFGLFKGVTGRFVGPYMYEWPSSFSNNQSYPGHKAARWSNLSSSPLRWNRKNPISANALFNKLTRLLKMRLSASTSSGFKPTICINVGKQRISSFVKEFAKNESARTISRLLKHTPPKPLVFGYWTETVWPSLAEAEGTIAPQYILLAAGMGKETVKLVVKDRFGNTYNGQNFLGTNFWAKDSLMSPNTPNLRVSIFGGGDGALQDALRTLTRQRHPLEFIEYLLADPVVKKAMDSVTPDLLAIDRQGRQFGTWTLKNAFRTVDTCCREVATQLASKLSVAQRVAAGVSLGTGTVSLFVRGPYFDKAYLLNRFMVHLIAECKKAHPSLWSGRVNFEVHFNHQAVAYAKSGSSHEVTILSSTFSSSHTHLCDVIAVRYGITPGTVPGAQMIQVSKNMSKQRTTLSRVELPFVAEKD